MQPLSSTYSDASDYITTVTTIIACEHAGIPVFVISLRNSHAAFAHLVEKTGVTHLFLTGDNVAQQISSAGLKSVKHHVHIIDMLRYEQLYESKDPFVPFEVAKWDEDAQPFTMHSSGSTNFPKPIKVSNKFLTAVARTCCA